MKRKKCIVCGFDKGVQSHHLQKVMEFGSEDDSNKIYLCPNHHWVADFGDDQDKLLLLRKIKEITGKEPLIDFDKKKYFDKLIRANIENSFGELSDKEYENSFKNNSCNYDHARKILLSRSSSSEYLLKKNFTEKCELFYLRNLINKQLKNLNK